MSRDRAGGARSRRPSACPPETAKAGLGEAGEALEQRLQGRLAEARETVRPAPVLGLERLDEPALLESREGRIEGPGAQVLAGDREARAHRGAPEVGRAHG